MRWAESAAIAPCQNWREIALILAPDRLKVRDSEPCAATSDTARSSGFSRFLKRQDLRDLDAHWELNPLRLTESRSAARVGDPQHGRFLEPPSAKTSTADWPSG
jgi:hypothetical protein